eukprot:2186040-Alexandrium_andersonii.AAC.1
MVLVSAVSVRSLLSCLACRSFVSASGSGRGLSCVGTLGGSGGVGSAWRVAFGLRCGGSAAGWPGRAVAAAA